MTHPTSRVTSAGHRPGVYLELDQAKMPKPPADWIGVKLYDHHGEPIGIGYVPPDHADRLLSVSANQYVEARSSAEDAALRPPVLRLVGPERSPAA